MIHFSNIFFFQFFQGTFSHSNIFSIFSEVLLGDWKISSDPDCTSVRGRKNCFAKRISRKVSKVIKHENYEISTIKNDIALLRLDRAVPLYDENPKISAASPICLPWKKDNLARDLIEGDFGLVTGWGRVTNDLAEASDNFRTKLAGSDRLKSVKVPVKSKTDCGDFGLDTEKQMCAGGVVG